MRCRTIHPAFLLPGFLILSFLSTAQSQEPATSAAPIYDLGQCLAIAKERSPILKAARASLSNAQLGLAALEKPGVLIAITPDFHVRREQAMRGVAIAEAELMQAEYDVAYVVKRLYYTAIYANQQHRVAAELQSKLAEDTKTIEDKVAKGDVDRTVNKGLVLKAKLGVTLAERGQVEAEIGAQRARAALAEAMGLDSCHVFSIRSIPFGPLAVSPTCEQLLELALSRRGEVMQARLGAEVFGLEEDAQASAWFRPSFRTFALGADIHGKTLNGPNYGADYMPGALSPEMPTNLAGNKHIRTARAGALAERSQSVSEKVQNLITLEVRSTFLVWKQANSLIEIETRAKKLADERQEFFKGDAADADRFTIKLETYVDSARTTKSLNEAILTQIVTSLGFERLTAGGIRVELPGVICP